MVAKVKVKVDDLGPPQKIRDEIEVLHEFVERFKKEVKVPEICTLSALAAKLNEIRRDVNQEITSRELQKFNGGM